MNNLVFQFFGNCFFKDVGISLKAYGNNVQDVKLYTKCISVGLRISGVIFNPENIFFKWSGSHLTVMHIQLQN